MKNAKRVCSWVVFGLIIMVGIDAHPAVVSYTLDHVILEDGAQMTGTFSWTYDVGDFENGVGQFTSLVIPHTSHNHLDLETTI